MGSGLGSLLSAVFDSSKSERRYVNLQCWQIGHRLEFAHLLRHSAKLLGKRDVAVVIRRQLLELSGNRSCERW